MAEGLRKLLKAIVGKIPMSEKLDDMFQTIWLRKVPREWTDGVGGCGFASLKGLGGWPGELASRVDFFRGWLMNGRVASYFLR